MPCVALPAPPAPPDLPSGITLEPSLPIPNLDPALCCKVFDMPDAPALIALPPGIYNAALAATINTLIAGVVAHCRGRALNCPKE